MDSIDKLLAEYRKNCIWISQFKELCREDKPILKWYEEYNHNIRYYHTIFRRNTQIFEEIMGRISHDLSEEDADAAYLYLTEMDKAEYSLDGVMIYSIFQKLIPFYEEKKDYEKIITLHGFSEYIHNVVMWTKFHLEHKIFWHSEKNLTYKDQYFELKSSNAKLRYLASYYNVCIPRLDFVDVSADLGYEQYEAYQQFWNSKKVQEQDGNDETLLNFSQIFRRTLLNLETDMSKLSPKYQKVFLDLVEEFYGEEFSSVKDPLELDTYTFGVYLRKMMLTKEKTLEEAFDLLVTYFRQQFSEMSDSDETTDETIFEMVRSCAIAVRWITYGVPKDKATKVVCDMLTMIETKWKKLKYVQSDEIDDMMYDFVQLVFDMSYESTEKERYAFEFGIRRQLCTFMNAITVKNIASQFLHEILSKKKEVFASLGKMSEIELTNYVEQCALIHNIGNIHFHFFRDLQVRKLTNEELSWVARHTTDGAKMVLDVKEMQQYHDVILYHHSYYNGEDKGLEEINYKDPSTKPVVDLIALIDFIDEFTNPLLCETYHTDDFAVCMKEIVKGKGTRFNPELVDILLDSYELQQKIRDYLTKGRAQLVYGLFHSFDVGETDEEKEQYLKETLGMIKEAKNQNSLDEKSFSDLLKRVKNLFSLSESMHSFEFVGNTFYAAFLYYSLLDDWNNMIKYALQAIRFLQETREYDIIIKLYEHLGEHALSNGDFQNGVLYYLKSAEFGLKANDMSKVKTAYLKVSNIYKVLDQYEMALEYLERSFAVYAGSLVDQSRFLAFKGYYLCKLSKLDEARDVKKKLDTMDDIKEESVLIIYHVFLAFFAFCNKKHEDALREVKILSDDFGMEDRNYLAHHLELEIYFELLECLGMNEKLLNAINLQLDAKDQETCPPYLYKMLLQHGILAAKKIDRKDCLNAYCLKLSEILLAEKTAKGKQVKETEEMILASAKMDEKYEELILEHYRKKVGMQEIEHANETKNTFLTSMSHEIRTPINAVLGLDEMILRETKDDHIKSYAKDIQTAGKTLLGLINDILDYSNLEAGKMELVPEEYLVKDLVRELDHMIASRAEEKKLRFHIKLNSSVPVKLFGDDLRIKQIILNLLTNAVKYTEKGSITFSVDFEKKDEEHIFLKILVQDTGIGLKPEEIENLSKPFERLDVKRNRTIEGSGLGMSIVTNLLNQMGSKLQVESNYGVGSSFFFVLEQRVVDWTEIGNGSENSGLVKKKKIGPLFVAPNVKILVVDDTAVNLTVIKGLLRQTKVGLTMAKSGKECLAVCQKEKFHVILMDHRMPEMDGVETLHQLRKEEGPNQNTPVIAVTANAITGAYDYYTNEGFDELVIKPVNGQILEEKIMKYLNDDGDIRTPPAFLP